MLSRRIRKQHTSFFSRRKEIFTSKKPYQKLSEIMYELDKADLLEKGAEE